MEKELHELVIMLKGGEKSAFDRLFHIFHPRIYNFCRHYHMSKEEAEEIVQDVFIKVWLNRASIDATQNVQSYIYTIAKNLILNNFKRKIYQRAAYDYHISQQGHIQMEEEIIGNDLSKMIESAINELPQKRRAIFNLSRKEGLSNKEIAERLDISLKTVESQMRLSLQFLRQVLKSNANLLLLLCLVGY